ncbi:hypothetical protein MTO96_027302 [Rhipicephalus appendiculatus]
MANSDIGVGKSIAVLAIVVGCFTVLWPKVFYPMMQAAFSITFSSQEGQDGMIPGRGAQSRMHEGHGPGPTSQSGVCQGPSQDSGSRETWSHPEQRGTSGYGSPGHRVHPGDSSRQNPMGEVEELKRRLAQTEALLQQLLIRQSGGAQSASTNTNMSHSINLLVRELSKGTPRTPLRERHEGLRHRRPAHQTSEDEPACPCGAPLSSESCQGGSQPDSCSEGTAESGDEASLPLERETVAY